MKIVQRPEAILTLLFLGVGCIWFFLNDYFAILLNKYSGSYYLQFFTEHKRFLLVATIAAFIFFGVRFFTNTLADSQKLYYNLFVNNPVPMGIIDSETHKFLAVNLAATDCYGYTHTEVLTMSEADIIVQQELEEQERDFISASTGFKKGGINKHRKKNGEVFLTEVSYTEIIFKKRKCRLFLARDLTEIVKAREEKRIAEESKTLQENFTAFVLQNFPVDVAVFDANHRYLLLNKTAVKNDEMRSWMIGKDDFDYFRRKGTDLTMAEKRRELFMQALRGESTEWIDEHMVDGRLKYVLRKFFPYVEDGKIKYVYGYGTDITEIKKAQNQKDEYLEQLEKFAFTTSHKLRQPICNLQGLVSLLDLSSINEPEIKQIINGIQISVDNMDACTRELANKLHEYKQQLSDKNTSKPATTNAVINGKSVTISRT